MQSMSFAETVSFNTTNYNRRDRQMVSLIPRLSSFAVSGTPAKSQVADLSHVLKYDPSVLSWMRMLSSIADSYALIP